MSDKRLFLRALAFVGASVAATEAVCLVAYICQVLR